MQNKKSILNNGKYILIAVILIFAIGAGILNYFYNKENTISIPSVSKEVADNKEDQKEETVIAPEEKWKTYTSNALGFSIKYPEMVYGVYKCSPQKPFYVPLKIFEDEENGIVYLTQEYYYSDWDSKLQNNTGSCKKIINSLESLNEQKAIVVDVNGKVSLNSNPFLTRVFVIKNIKNDIELDEFIKDNYGSGCFVNSKKPLGENGVYEIEIKGEDWGKADLGATNCPRNYTYKILYAPEKNKLMSVNLGQECGFGTQYISEESYKCYDEEMIDSFKFE